jgi:hypothetical protein
MRLFLVLLMAVVGAAVGSWQTVTRVYPLPHHIPKYEGGISLRFVMVHDVIHERYPWHSRAYYEERNRRARSAIAEEDAKRRPDEAPTATYFALKDDLGVGLERLGRHEEAVSVMRDKLRQQEAAGLEGRDLYSTKANLGTFLILWQMQEGFADLPVTKKRLNEGLTLVRESMTVKPDAHYGREMWQAVLLEFFLAVLDDPKLLTRFDIVGNQLSPESGRPRSSMENKYKWKRRRLNRDAAIYLRKQAGEPLTLTADVTDPNIFRQEIHHVGAEEGWTEAVKSVHQKPVPFDEPTLGIVGMWRYGGGPNPHFALALGEIMLRVGQRYIAWCAYERAVLLSAHFNSDAKIVSELVSHCRARQSILEERIPPDERAELRPRFEKELAFGKRYQTAYQEYEEKKIRDGADLDDPQFYDVFEAEHGPIATPVGEEDQFIIAHSFTSDGLGWREWFAMISWSSSVLYAGLFAFGTACLVRLLEWCGVRFSFLPPARRSSPPPTAPPPDAAAS